MNDDEGLVREALAALSSLDAPPSLRQRTDAAVGQRRRRNRVRLVVASVVATIAVVSGAVTIAAAAGHHDGRIAVVSPKPSGASSTTVAAGGSSTSTSTSTTVPASTTTVGTPGSTGGHGIVVTTTPTTAAPGPAELHATPAAGLSERTAIVLSGSGLPPDQRVFVIACRAAAAPSTAAGPPGCDEDWWNTDMGVFFTDTLGNLRTQQFFVRRVFADGTDCTTTPGGCELRIILHSAADILARTPLSFAGPSGPSRPTVLHVTPATGLADGQIVQVSGANFVSVSTRIFECAGNTCEQDGTEVTPGADGSFTSNITAHGTFSAGTGVQFDCSTAHCVIAASPVGDDGVPISFAPPPPPTTTTSVG